MANPQRPVLTKLPEFSRIKGNEPAILGHFGYQTIFEAKKAGNQGNAPEIYNTLMKEANKSIQRENKIRTKIYNNRLQEFNLAEVIKKLKDRENNRKKYYTIAVEILEQKKFNANGDKKTYETTRVYEDANSGEE